MKSVAIVQARMSSERLPGKVLKPLAGIPVLAHVIGRLRNAKRIDEVMIATSDGGDDDAVADFAAAQDCAVYRGSLTDVLSRFVGAAHAAKADVIVRVTADCPLICPEVIDAMLGIYGSNKQGKPCVVTNARVRTFPRGLDAEVFAREVLDIAAKNAREDYQREHVTPYLYAHPELFEIVDHVQSRDASTLRWTLDTADDYRMLRAFFDVIADPLHVGVNELLALWDAHPEFHEMNAHVVQKAAVPASGPR